MIIRLFLTKSSGQNIDVKIPTPGLGLFGSTQFNYEIREIILEYNNDEYPV